ncbi:MAG: hypothetical protein PQ612_06410 [Rickettsiales bacterium]|nr:hypothetical protein [Pseudomonadota bacterium]MDA0966605.1 hypothetical protein [Pseudomonadota bacterium]MDG4543633.1 hypothetical protein [Rickettsiales bacterium]MDG4545780.1 hypothetical protein [Rickettsiales bacterium]MDG4547446.1 hypothetical protein [Rickettsiales bacterium]
METDLQPATSVSSRASTIFLSLLTLAVGGAGAYFAFKPKKAEADAEKTPEALPVTKGQTLIDPQTGEELIVTKKGGRKKKVTTEQVTPPA